VRKVAVFCPFLKSSPEERAAGAKQHYPALTSPPVKSPQTEHCATPSYAQIYRCSGGFDQRLCGKAIEIAFSRNRKILNCCLNCDFRPNQITSETVYLGEAHGRRI
jgi:hypothetical protein